jgi:hypothetical protein
MRLESIFLARYAEISDGLLTVVGAGWDNAVLPPGPVVTLTGEQVTARLMRGAVVARFLLGRDEANSSHEIDMVIRDADQIGLIAIHASVVNSASTENLPDDWIFNTSVVVDLTGAPLPGPGVYEVVVTMAGEDLGRTRFHVLDGDPPLPGS